MNQQKDQYNAKKQERRENEGTRGQEQAKS